MDFGDPIIYECPSCNIALQEMPMSSYHVRKGQIFSDGFHSGYPSGIDFDLVKCPHCAAVFFLHNLKGRAVNFYIAPPSPPSVEKLALEDLLKADDDKIAKTNDDQYRLSFDLWRALNREYLYNGGKLPAKIKPRYKKHCKILYKFVKEKLRETMNEQEDIPSNEVFLLNEQKEFSYYGEDMYGEEESLKMIAAELCRYLGFFDECLFYLKSLPVHYSWKKLLMADRAIKGERALFEMRKDDWYRVRARSGETWQTWECGAKTGDAVIAVVEDKTLTFYGEGAMKDYAPLPDIKHSDAPWCDPDNIKKVKHFDFSDDITRIGAYAFYGSDFSFAPREDSNIESIGKYAFSNTKISKAQIPWRFIELEEGTFANCKKLTTVELCDGLKHIGDNAFFACTHLSEIEIPESVISIGKEAFASCDRISKIIIGEHVQNIGDGAFAKSKKSSKEEFALKSVINHSDEPQLVNEGLFKNCDLSKAVLTVPSESLKAYKKAPVWKDFGKFKTFKKLVQNKTDDSADLSLPKNNPIPSLISTEAMSGEDYLDMLGGDSSSVSSTRSKRRSQLEKKLLSYKDYIVLLEKNEKNILGESESDENDFSLPPLPARKAKRAQRPTKKKKEI
jgi:hypothetical protein